MTASGPAVDMAIGGGSGSLESWGQSPDGGWWALVRWLALADDGISAPIEVACAGWLSADDVRRVEGVDYSAVQRAALGPDADAWPPPRGEPADGQPGVYFGLMRAGQLLPPPDGMQWSRPRRGRMREPRYEHATLQDRFGRDPRDSTRA
jgi:hypothetical protein